MLTRKDNCKVLNLLKQRKNEYAIQLDIVSRRRNKRGDWSNSKNLVDQAVMRYNFEVSELRSRYKFEFRESNFESLKVHFEEEGLSEIALNDTKVKTIILQERDQMTE